MSTHKKALSPKKSAVSWGDVGSAGSAFAVIVELPVIRTCQL